MLTQRDFEQLSPYLTRGKVVNMEVKDRGRKGREVLLEYDNGEKLVGDLNQQPLTLAPLTGLKSIVSYFARGKYGATDWRGNCSGLLIKDLLDFYKPDTFGDLAVGSGTAIDVAKDLGYTSANTVFNDLNPRFGGVDISAPDIDFPLLDFIFFHPPYYVFPGSKMPVYSGKKQGGMWGDEVNDHDGSRIADPWEFKLWFDRCNANLYKLLRKGGRLAILMGDSRFRGQYFSMFKEMDIYGTLEQVIIKEQHNSWSNQLKYAGKFIPIAHEYLVIIRKEGPFIVPISYVRHTDKDMRKSEKITWANLIAMLLEDAGGQMRMDVLIHKMEEHPKARNNNHVAAKLRQELQRHSRMFIKDNDMVRLACA